MSERLRKIVEAATKPGASMGAILVARLNFDPPMARALLDVVDAARAAHAVSGLRSEYREEDDAALGAALAALDALEAERAK